MVKHYHRSLWQIYSFSTTKIPSIEPDLIFQIFFKAINDSVGPNELVLTLSVFDAYFKMTELDASSLSITQRAMAMKKAMNEIQKCTVSQKVNNALNIESGSSIATIYDLPINSSIFVYREGNVGQLRK